MTSEDARTQELARQLPAGYELPLIGGYRLTHHAARRMVARLIEIDWVAEALTRPSRTRRDGTRSFFGDMAMCVVDHSERVIVTVSYGLLNGGVE